MAYELTSINVLKRYFSFFWKPPPPPPHAPLTPNSEEFIPRVSLSGGTWGCFPLHSMIFFENSSTSKQMPPWGTLLT